MPVVFPAHQRRQGHQDRFGAPAGLQTKQRAPVVNQVELDIAAPPVELEVPLPLTPGHGLATGDDGPVGGHITVADGPQEGEAPLETQLAEIIKEKPSHTAGLGAVLEVEIRVAPVLETGIEISAKGFAGGLRGPMPVLTVLREGVVRGQIIAATKPPDRRLPILFGNEETHIGVGSGYVRVLRVNHQRDPHSLEGAPRQLRPRRGGGGGQAGAVDMGEVHPALLDHSATGKHPGAPSAALGP